MIRKAIIVVLTLGAVSVTVMSVISYGTWLRSEDFWLGDRDIFLFGCDAGHAKLTWVREAGGSLDIFRRNDDTVVSAKLRQDLLIRTLALHLAMIQPRYIPRVLWRLKLSTRPPIERTEIQVWTWMVVATLGAYPALAFIRGPLRRWRRHRKGLCIRCGYNLEGNVSGVCSECGEAR